MYKERVQHSEDTPVKVYYTDRQGVPVAIDITGKEGRQKLTDNSNFFALGPSGSGKSFHMNSVVRQLHEQGTDIVMVDTGNSYEGLCEYLGGKYISYTGLPEESCPADLEGHAGNSHEDGRPSGGKCNHRLLRCVFQRLRRLHAHAAGRPEKKPRHRRTQP